MSERGTWIAHVKTFRNDHPGMSWRAALEEAKESYTKVLKPPKSSNPSRRPNPWLAHVAAYRESHPGLKFKEVLQQARETYAKSERAAGA